MKHKSSSVYILGISAYYHDSAACLLKDGEIIAAAQEERFTRKKHDHDFPRHAIQYCLQEGGIGIEQVDYVAFYDKPFIKFNRGGVGDGILRGGRGQSRSYSGGASLSALF